MSDSGVSPQHLRYLLEMAERGALVPSSSKDEFSDAWDQALRDGLIVVENDECILTEKGSEWLHPKPSYTIGWLVQELAASEKALQSESWRPQLFQPDPMTMPGID